MIAGDPSNSPESIECPAGSGTALDKVALQQLAATLGCEHEQVVEPRFRRIDSIIIRLVRSRGLNYRHLGRLVELLVELASLQREHEERESLQVYPAIGEILCNSPVGSGMAAYFLHRTLALEDGHQAMAGVLDELRRLTGDYRIPPDVCPNYRDLMESLSALDIILRRHWEQEEQILFPQVLELACSHAGRSGEPSC